jgi:hypothetical protein
MGKMTILAYCSESLEQEVFKWHKLLTQIGAEGIQ